MHHFDPNALPVPDLGLACPNCGYPLANLPNHRCPECGRPFTLEEFIPKGDFPPLIADGHEVRATDEVVALLRQYQIPYAPLHEPVQDMLGGLSLSGFTRSPRIAVPRDRYLEAIDLIRRHTHGELMPDEPIAADPHNLWTCPACQELNPGNFDLCWNCGADRPTDDDDHADDEGERDDA